MKNKIKDCLQPYLNNKQKNLNSLDFEKINLIKDILHKIIQKKLVSHYQIAKKTALSIYGKKFITS